MSGQAPRLWVGVAGGAQVRIVASTAMEQSTVNLSARVSVGTCACTFVCAVCVCMGTSVLVCVCVCMFTHRY